MTSLVPHSMGEAAGQDQTPCAPAISAPAAPRTRRKPLYVKVGSINIPIYKTRWTRKQPRKTYRAHVIVFTRAAFSTCGGANTNFLSVIMKTRTVITTFVFLTLLSGGLLPPITRLSAADTTNTTKKAPSEGVGLTNEPSIKAERKVKTPSTAEFMRLITDSGFEISQWGATYNVPSLGLLASDVDCTHKSSHLKLSLYCDLNNTNRYKLIAKNNEAEVKALKEIAAKLSAQLPPAIDEIIGRIKQGVKKDTIELGGMAVATLDGNNIMLQTNPEP